MEVPYRTDLPRYYLPWDALQLDDRLQSGWRPNKNSVQMSGFKGLMRSLWWLPLLQSNALYFYDKENNLYDCLNGLIRLNRLNSPGTATLELYDFKTNDQKYHNYCSEKDKEFFFVHHHPYEKSLNNFLDRLLEFRKNIMRKTHELGVIEAGTKKLQFIILHLSDEMCEELRHDQVMVDKICDLMQNSSDARLYLFLFTRTAINFPLEIIGSSDYTPFFGKENEQWCRNEVYPDRKLWKYNRSREILGVIAYNLYPELTPFHDGTKKTLSNWTASRVREGREEARIYQEFLDTLDDGSSMKDPRSLLTNRIILPDMEDLPEGLLDDDDDDEQLNTHILPQPMSLQDYEYELEESSHKNDQNLNKKILKSSLDKINETNPSLREDTTTNDLKYNISKLSNNISMDVEDEEEIPIASNTNNTIILDENKLFYDEDDEFESTENSSIIRTNYGNVNYDDVPAIIIDNSQNFDDSSGDEEDNFLHMLHEINDDDEF